MLTATYSPEDNKLRLYASSRLDPETYARVKDAILENSHGFSMDAELQAVEVSHALADSLYLRYRSLSWPVHIHEADFLECNGNLGKFDRVLMNPPFSGGQDIKHIKHAVSFLKPGGRLVAICANGPRQQEQLRPLASTWEELPADTFKESGTSVRAVLLTINA